MIMLENRDALLAALAVKAQENWKLVAELLAQGDYSAAKEYHLGQADAFREAERLVGLYLAE